MAGALHDGWYRTRDVGFLWHGELFVLGRKDDVVIVGGKNLYPQDVDEIAAAHPEIHDGRVVVFGLYNPELETQDLVIIAEVSHEESLQRRSDIELEIRQRVLGEVGVAPRLVYVVPPRWIVKSTAGKPARSTNRQKLFREVPELDPESRQPERRAVGT